MRRSRLVPAALAAVLALGLPAQAAPGGTGAVPVEGSTTWSAYGVDDRPLVRAVLHAVRRVPGGTAVYWSVGAPRGEEWADLGAAPPARLSEDFEPNDLYLVQLVDPVGLTAYLPLVDGDGCLCTQSFELGDEAGVLHVAYAVLPPLPDDVDTVDVRLGEGLLLGVPVGEGALAPAVDAPSVPLGAGWPALPDVATARDPAAQVRPLVRNVEEPERGLRTQERADEVAESLATDVLFAVDSAELDPAAQAVLGELAARLRERATGTVQVVGHTDGTGETAYNQQLSQARADAVAQVLRAAAPGLALEASGRGESEPVADDSTEEGRALNRRVTVVYGLRQDA